MKLVTLNTQGGALTPALLDFLKRHQDVEIFCLQEVYHDAAQKEDKRWVLIRNMNLLRDMQAVMPDYNVIFHPHWGDYWGLTMFIKKDISLLNSGDIFVHKKPGWNYDLELEGRTAKNLQYATLETPLGARTVINFHGLWNGGGKGDSEERLLQSQSVVTFLKTLTDPYILAGDYNLNPDTTSLEILESHGMRNLIKEFGINSTRTSLYTKDNKYADYVLVSGGVEVLDFTVLPDEVSDHSPLFLEFQ
jgi:endonuclease/exonuclease/phosphatase family metal-dependent hydrolase